MDSIMKTLRSVWQKVQPVWQKAQPVFQRAGEIAIMVGGYVRIAWRYMVRFRKVILAVPVAIAAVCLAIFTSNRLPEYVGIDLQATGEYAQLVTRDIAVLGPLAVTATCLLLMFCSRRTLYPWLISVFSLTLPLLILVTNLFTA